MKKAHKGFTLIELLVVVLIIGVLAAIALPVYRKSVERARFARVQHLAAAVFMAQKAHFMETGSYAKTFDELGIDIPWTGNITTGMSFFGQKTDSRSEGTAKDGWQIVISANQYYESVFLWRLSSESAGWFLDLKQANPVFHCVSRSDRYNYNGYCHNYFGLSETALQGLLGGLVYSYGTL